MTSLTPHQDAARQLIEQAEAALADEMRQPGERAMRHRVNHAMSKAFLLARAAEIDAGFTPDELEIASVVTLANIGSTIVSTDAELDTRSREALQLGLILLGDVATQLQKRLGPASNAPRLSQRVSAPAGGSA
ncbi:hypothetical protein ACFPOB_26050 [Bosea eneae]|uniref:Uncharacterized protein n=1 Tax=Bosea eneae TaxID=151454 RepID=A0ABW0IXF9_9HYPH